MNIILMVVFLTQAMLRWNKKVYQEMSLTNILRVKAALATNVQNQVYNTVGGRAIMQKWLTGQKIVYLKMR